jgi:hypothetical protein
VPTEIADMTNEAPFFSPLNQFFGASAGGCADSFGFRTALAHGDLTEPDSKDAAVDRALRTGSDRDVSLAEGQEIRAHTDARRVSTVEAIAFAYAAVSPLAIGF